MPHKPHCGSQSASDNYTFSLIIKTIFKNIALLLPLTTWASLDKLFTCCCFNVSTKTTQRLNTLISQAPSPALILQEDRSVIHCQRVENKLQGIDGSTHFVGVL